MHRGKATKVGLKIVLLGLILLMAVLVGGLVAARLASFIAMISTILVGLWAVFALFTLYFFRDPEPRVSPDPDAIVAPAHGKVDAIEEVTEPDVLGGPCRRISTFLSVFDVHVQYAPVEGRVSLVHHRPGQFLNAMRADSAALNENVLIGLETDHQRTAKVAVRLIAGLIARRIVPWVQRGDEVAKGSRVSLIQFGSRVDLYLPLTARVQVSVGDRVRGGETVMALRG